MLIDKAIEKSERLRDIDTIFVEDMEDGGMGSLIFINDAHIERQLGETISEAEFFDKDGSLVSVALNLDSNGELYELDIWKVNFNKLEHIPGEDKIIIKT